MPVAPYPYPTTGSHPGYHPGYDAGPPPPPVPSNAGTAYALSQHAGSSFTSLPARGSHMGGPGSHHHPPPPPPHGSQSGGPRPPHTSCIDNGHLLNAQDGGGAPLSSSRGGDAPLNSPCGRLPLNSHSSGRVPLSSHSGMPLTSISEGQPLRFHNEGMMQTSQREGSLPDPHGGGGGGGGRPTNGYHGHAGVPSSCREVGYKASYEYPPAPVLNSRLPYGNPRGDYRYGGGTQALAYDPIQGSSLGYDASLNSQMRPPQPYHKYRDGEVPYPAYLQQSTEEHQVPQSAELNSHKYLMTSKSEPEWWQDCDLLDRLQKVHLQADDSPVRERTTPRRRRRNSEKRKEKSRDAARCRRGKESEIFTELAAALPMPPQTVSQLDKASVMRLTIAYLRTRALCQDGLSKTPKSVAKNEEKKMDLEMDGLFLKALDGFLMVLSTDGDVVYISENIVTFLGLQQVDMMGQSVYEYVHPCDHEEIRDLVSPKPSKQPRHAFLRIKCTLTGKGRSVNLKSASYKVVQVSGDIVHCTDEQETWLVALGNPVPHPSNIEIPLDKQVFVSKHSLDMKFNYVDDNVNKFCDYDPDELVGRSLYEMHHALDSDLIKDAYKTLRSKGQVETGRYRFLARGGGYVWVVTQATLIDGPKDHKPQHVVCLNYVVSGVECPNVVLSELQLNSKRNTSNINSSRKVLNQSPERVGLPSLVPLANPPVQSKVPHVNGPAIRVTPVPPPPPTPVAATFKIFTPRTEEMNKGYLTFADNEQKNTVLKEEPDDLTHLAPSVGDTCVPLEVPTFIPANLGDGILGFDYAELPVTTDVFFSGSTPVPDDTEVPHKSAKYNDKLTDGKKFGNRSSEGKIVITTSTCNSAPTDCCSPPASGFRTPEPPKPFLSQAAQPLPREKKLQFMQGEREVCQLRTATESPYTLLDEFHAIDSTADVFTKLDFKLEDKTMDTDEFEMRAPFIPLTNEMLMISPDDFFWGDQQEAMVSPTAHHSPYREENDAHVIHDKEDSSLAQLLTDTDPPLHGSGTGSGTPPGIRRNTPPRNNNGQRNQYQQNKFLDSGGSFVDPNKVLPCHFVSKDELLDGVVPGRLLSAEEDPPPVMVQEPVEPPPPLLTVDTEQVSNIGKRGLSPGSPNVCHKKLCSPSCQEWRQQQSHSEIHSQNGMKQQQQQPSETSLPTPYAPMMQQLLVSKEPITVRGGRLGGGLSTSKTSNPDKGHSVLRNLLVSGRDDSAGYSVSASASPAGTPTRSSAGSPGPRLVREENQGGKNVSEADTTATTQHQPRGSGTSSPILAPPHKMATVILTGGGSATIGANLNSPRLRLVTGKRSTFMQAGEIALKMSSNQGVQPGGNLVKRQRQDPLLLMDPDLTIPNLLDLTQLDYEVNAPATTSNLLQGADLLMALDQSL